MNLRTSFHSCPVVLGRHRARIGCPVLLAFGLTPPSLEYHLTRLSKAGIVEVTPFEEDRRHRLVELTPSGRMILLANQYSEG